VSHHKEVLFMTMQGQPSGEPGEGELSLDSLAAMMDSNDEAPDEAAESDAADESEQIEAEGDGSPDEESQDEDEAEEPAFTIKHDGKDVTLKQSEVLEMAQKGFDFTKKTMALAEERKALEPIKAKAEEARQHNEAALNHTVAQLQAVVSFMQSEIGEPPPVEWASQDAGYYIAQKEQYESRKGKLEKAQHALAQAQHDQARQRHALITQTLGETQAELKNTLPDWNDAKEEELAQYVAKAGLTPDKADMAYWKSGFWLLAHKAKAFDALQAEKAKLKPVTQLQKVIKPSANNQPPQLAKHQEKVKAHKSRPSLSTLADLL
jgi:hypothetical protein